MTKKQTTVIKTTVNLPPDAVDAIREIAEKRGTTMTDVIRQAIAMEKLVFDTNQEGGKVLIEDRDKTIKQILIR